MPKEATTELHSVKTTISFEVFKAEFENTHVFKKFQKERLVKLKEAFKIATSEFQISK
jgi:hypothetical protein